MSEARIHRNAEHLVEGDWLDSLVSLHSTFGVLLSDLTSGNIPYEHRRRFYTLIADALAPGGVLLDKVLTHNSAFVPLSQLVDKYASLPPNLLHVNHFSSEVLFCSELLADRRVVDSTLFYESLASTVTNPRVTRFAQLSQLITPPGCVWWYGRPWTELCNDYGIGLRTISVHDENPPSPYAGRLKYFHLEKDNR